jgi:phosphopantothenoylcysteine decarboxylase/phosphopantothenate--cysteine ligase
MEEHAKGASGSRLVLLGVTGSIAAFKACEIGRDLLEREFRVRVLMTPSATQFVSPMTFHTLTGEPPVVDMFESPELYLPHLSLAHSASLALIAPATANILGRIAHGLADDIISATIMATTAPVLIAPAMNVNMWKSAAVQENVKLLASRGFHFVGPVVGKLAAPFEGEAEGRMSEPSEIVAEALKLLGKG